MASTPKHALFPDLVQAFHKTGEFPQCSNRRDIRMATRSSVRWPGKAPETMVPAQARHGWSADVSRTIAFPPERSECHPARYRAGALPVAPSAKRVRRCYPSADSGIATIAFQIGRYRARYIRPLALSAQTSQATANRRVD